uniref:Peptidase S74 domain-containing protein n=1 Tax=candidate division CPR3 bacterium TaxID=2268181 RepID=A0A7C4R5X4_UNCC3
MKKTKLLLIAIAMMGILFPLSGSALSGKSPLAGLVFEQIGSEGLTDFVIGEGVGYGGNVSLTGGNTSSNIKTGATNIIYRNVTTNITPTSFLSYSPTFSSLAVNSMTTPGIIKNDERGNFIGGQKITSNDILNASLLSGNGIVFSGSPLNRLLGSENITISLDKNVPTKVSTDGNIIASIMDNTLYLSLKGSTPVVPPAGSGVSYGTGGTVIASIDDGTLANQTARWDNVANKWVGDSSLTNDGTDIGVTNNLTVGGTITINGVTFTNTDVNNWNTTFGWGDHSTAGYFVAGDNISGLTNDAGYITASSADALTNKTGNISMWTNDSGYLTALTLAASETDPIYTAWDKSTGISIISTQVTDFNAAAIAAPLTGFVAGTNAGTITNVDTILSGLQAAQNQIDALGAVSHVAVTLGAVPNGMTLTGQQINLSAADGLGTDGYLSSADWTIFNNKENALIAGAIGEYYRGDKTWQTLDTVAVVENGAGGLYFTDTRAINAVLSTFGGGVNSPIVNTDTIVQALEKAQGQIDAITLNFDENVDDRVAALIIPGASITSIYNDGAGTLTIDTAQDIQTTATPIFAGLTLNGNLNMGANAIVLNGDTVTDFTGTSTPNTFVGLTNQAGGLGVRINNLNLTTTLGGILNTVQPINTTASPQFSGLNILGNIATTGTVDGIDLSVKAIDWDAKLNANLANGLIWVGNAGTPTAVAMSGGATMNNAGVITLDNASVVNQALTGFVAGTNIGSITSADTIISGLKAAQDQIDILAAGVGHAAITVDAAGIANGLSEIGGQVLTLATAGAAQNGALTSADWTTFNSKENAIVAGLATEYWRGDKTWATLDTSVVPENGNLYYTDARARLALSSTGAPLQYNNLTGVFSIDQASTATDGYLTAVDWNIFNSKQDALVIGNTTTTTSGITIGGGVGSVIGAGLTIDIQNATGLQNGLLTSADWTIFNSKENGIVAGLATDYWRGDKTWSDFNTDVSANPDVAANTAARHNALTLTTTASGITLDGAQGLTILAADGANDGFLTSTDWIRFDALDTALTGGLVSQYLRGDKTWQILDTSVVPENGNLYYTTPRFDADFATKTTDDLTEGATNLYYTDARSRLALSSAGAPLQYNNLTGVFSIDQADTATDGYLTAVDWNTFNNKQNALVFGDITSPNAAITVTNGVGSTVGPNVTIDIANADGTTTGLLTFGDWNTFNNKENAIVSGLATDYWRGDKTWSDFNTDVSANPDVAANTAARHNAVTIGTANGLSIDPAQALSLATADAVTTGALTAADWTTFNNKQNALVIGDVTTTTTGVTIGGGVGSIIGGGLTIDIATADAATTGLLTSGDWTIFNAKQDALTAGNSIKIVANVIDTIQNIRTTDSPTFAGLTLNGDLLTSGLVDGIDLSAKAIDWDATKTKLDLLTYTLEGHGGGLDADTLDGFHASDFMSINGGSLNGTITTNVTNNGADTSIGLTISSANSAGNGTTGMGTSMMFALENATGVTQTSGEINNKWTNLNPGSQSSAITLKSWVNGLYRDALKIDNGVLTVPGAYNTIVGQPNRALYIDATGRIGYVASSERYKNSIADMEDIGWLYSLRPVNYVYNSDESGVKQYGLIAEEVAAVNSLFVSYNEDGSIETVNYNSFIPVLIKAVQDNKTSINGLSTTTDKIGLKLNDTSTALETAIATITDQQSQIENLQSDIANLNNTVSNIAASVNTNSEVTETAPITTTSSDEDIINLTDALNALTSEVNTLKVDMNTFRNAISVNALTGDATFMGHIYVNGDTAGKSEIAVGLTEIEVVFAKPYVGAPIINATPLDFITGQYKIAEVKSTGFKIVLSEAQATTVEFNWNALGR